MNGVGGDILALSKARNGLRKMRPSGLRGFIADLLIRHFPGTIREILRRKRNSYWYKTSQSPNVQRVWAFADRHSIQPGQEFRLMMSAGPDLGTATGHVEVHRIGYYDGEDRCLLWRSDPVTISEHAMNNTAAALGPAWPCYLTVADTEKWRSGYHSVDFIELDGTRHADVAFVVVTSPERKVDILVKLATATYQAYNRWGGHNLYHYESPSVANGQGLSAFESDIPRNRGDMVTFDRPTFSEFWEWEYYFVLWLEKLAKDEGLSVAYATNFDLTRDPAFVSDCRLLVSVGHDEYWSKEEFDRTHDRIFRDGGNTLFLGANTAYWQVRYADVNALHGNEGRQLVCFKSDLDPIRSRIQDDPALHVTARFRENARRPESMLMGVAYQSNLPFRHYSMAKYAYRVVSTDLPFFDGTGYQPGDVVGDIIGHEWDNRDPEAEFACPGETRVEDAERLWRANHSRIEPIPNSQITTVFAGEVVDTLGRKGLAEAVYFESAAGAKVFSSGTNRWTWGLGKEGFVQERFQRFNRNLVLDFLQVKPAAHTLESPPITESANRRLSKSNQPCRPPDGIQIPDKRNA